MPMTTAQKDIAFLDTNALVDLFAYWMTCHANSFDLNRCSNFTQMQATLGSINPGLPVSGDQLEPVKLGQSLFHKMKTKSGKWDFLTSQLCLSELRHTLLEDRANEKLISSRIPYRLRKERPLIVYRRSLNQGDFSRLQQEIEDFFTDLTNLGIIVQNEKDNSIDFFTIAAIAEKIWSHILLDVMDAFIYASAVSCMSRVLVTRDSGFIDAVNKLHGPPNTEWIQIRKSLDTAISSLGVGYYWPEGRGVNSPFP